jgi:hypothetical protein
MNATAKVTMAGVRKLAVARWGKSAEVEHYPKAPDAAERERRRERYRQLVEEEKTLRTERKELGDTERPLCEAARFCVDVDGVPTVLAQLRAAVEKSERVADIKDRLADIDKEKGKCSTLRQRFEVWVVVGRDIGFPMRTHRAGADTLEELAERIKAA